MSEYCYHHIVSQSPLQLCYLCLNSTMFTGDMRCHCGWLETISASIHGAQVEMPESIYSIWLVQWRHRSAQARSTAGYADIDVASGGLNSQHTPTSLFSSY